MSESDFEKNAAFIDAVEASLGSLVPKDMYALACRGADAADRIAKLEAALEVCDRVLHFDLRKMITWGPDYNQAVKDAANVTRAALGGET